MTAGIIIFYAALKQLDEQEVDTVLVGDVYARLNLYFHIQRCRGKKLVMDYEQPRLCAMDKVQTGPEGRRWCGPYEMNTQDFPWEWIESIWRLSLRTILILHIRW